MSNDLQIIDKLEKRLGAIWFEKDKNDKNKIIYISISDRVITTDDLQLIGELSNLEGLTFHENIAIENIKGLDGLTNLKELHLTVSGVTKIEGLNKLTNLRELWLDGNDIAKIEGLDKLTNLQELRLDSNRISKIEGLDELLSNERD